MGNPGFTIALENVFEKIIQMRFSIMLPLRGYWLTTATLFESVNPDRHYII